MSSFLKNYKKIKLVILLLLAASLPYYLKISNVLIGIGALVTVVYSISNRRNIVRIDSLSIAIMAYFLLDVVGLTYTEKGNLSTGLFTLDKHQSLILIPLIFSDLRIEPKSRALLLYTFVGSCIVASIFCVGVVMHETLTLYDRFFHEWLFSHDRISEPIGMHAVYFALYLSFCVLILLSSIKDYYETLSAAKLFGIIVLVIYLLGMITTLGARTATAALIGIIFANVLVCAREQRSIKILLLAAFIPLLVAGLIWLNPVVKVRFMDILKSNYENSNYGSYFARTHIWVPGMEAIKENLLVGVGTGDHQSELNKKYLAHNYAEGVRLDFNMHSQYLQTALNFGMVGVMVLLSIFLIQINDGLRKRDFLYLSFVVLFMLACVTEAMLVVNKGTVFFVFFSFVFYKSKIDKQ